MTWRMAVRSMPAGILDRVRDAAAGVPPSFAKSIAETFGTRVAGIAVGVLTLTITARLLGPGGRGQFAVTMAALAMILQFGNAGLHSSATYWLAKDASRQRAVGNLLAWYSFGPVSFLCAVAFIAAWRWPQLLPDVPLSHLALAFAAGPPSMFILLAGNAFLGLGKTSAFNSLDLSGKLAGACAVVFLLWTGLGVVFAVYAALHFAIAASAYRRLIGVQLPSSPDWTLALEMTGFASRVFLVNLSMFLVLRLDLFMLNAMAGPAPAGIYSVAVQVGDILMLASASIAAILFPRLAGMSAEQRWGATTRVLRVSGAIFAAMALGLALLARPVFGWWLGVDFVGSANALYWLLPGLWCLGMNTLLHQHLATFGIPMFLVANTAAGAALNAALNVWAIPRFGVEGAAAVSSVTYTAILLSTVVYLKLSKQMRPVP